MAVEYLNVLPLYWILYISAMDHLVKWKFHVCLKYIISFEETLFCVDSFYY